MTGRRLVLIVEDNATVLGLLGRLLEDPEVQVALAPDAETALGLCAARLPDLAIIDYFLPGGTNGADLAAAIRPVPVVGITGRPDGWILDAFAAAGARGTLTKPLDVIALVRLVHRMMHGGPVDDSGGTSYGGW